MWRPRLRLAVSVGRSPAEAAARQDAFWEMHDGLRTRTWDTRRALGLDFERFATDRRSDAVRDRVRDDFRGWVKAGVATTPTLFEAGERHTSRISPLSGA